MIGRKTTTRGCTLALALVCLLAAASAQAEGSGDDTAENKADKKGEKNTVKTVVPDERSVDDSRFPSGFVTRVDVDDQARYGRDLGDALERVSGVNVERSAGFGRPAFATVRGGNSRQLAVSLNGMRISAPAGVGFDVGSLSLAGIDAADVYRGGAGTVQGAGALSGAIDLHTRLPRGKGQRASVSTLAGSWGTYGTVGQAALAGDDYALRFDGTWRQSQGDFDFVDDQGTTHQRVNNDHGALGLSAAGRFELGEHAIEPLVLYEQSEGGAPGPSEFQRQFDDARLSSGRLIGQLGWRRKNIASGAWGALDAEALGGYQRRDLDYENLHALPGDSRVVDSSTLQSFEADLRAGAWLAFGSLAHLSLEARTEAYSATHAQGFSNSAELSSIDAARRTLAAAVSDELLLFDDRVSLVGGLRVSHLRDTRDDGSQRSWAPLIPSAGVIWRAHKWFGLKANVARTFRAPDFDELYLDMVAVRGDPDLEPEGAVTWDAGVRLGPEDGVGSLQAVYFRNDIEQSIYFVARTAYLFEATNLGAGTSQGVEATLRLHPVERLRALATYTLTDATLDALADGVQVPGQPRHRVGVSGEVELAGLGPLEKLASARLFGQADWRSRVYLDSFGNLSNPPFWTLDLGAAVSPVEWVEVALNMRNLTDNRQGADSLQRPLPGRAFYGSLKVEFGAIE